MTGSALPKLHVVTNDSVLQRPNLPAVAADLLGTLPGRVAVHVRGPRTTGRRIHEVASTIARTAGTDGLVVNDRLDVALTLGCSVHLGARSLPVRVATDLMAGRAGVGRSVREHAEEGTGADYLFAGPVFATPSHPDHPGRGTEWLAKIVRQTDLPVVAIGGISAERIGVLLDAGAYGAAVIRAVWDADDPPRAALDLSARLEASTRA